MAGRIRTSEEIEKQIQHLLALKQKAVEREQTTKYTSETEDRLRKVLSLHCCELSEAEIDHILEPVKNYERNQFRIKAAAKRKNLKDTTTTTEIGDQTNV